MSSKKKKISIEELLLSILFFSSFIAFVIILINFYYFWKYGMIYLGAILLTIFLVLVIISSIAYFYSRGKNRTVFYSKIEERKTIPKIEIREVEESKQNKEEYELIKKYFQQSVQKKSPSVRELIEYVEKFERISITDITNYFYPLEIKGDLSVIRNVSWKTKEKIWENYKKIKMIIELLINEGKLKGTLQEIGPEIYYFK